MKLKLDPGECVTAKTKAWRLTGDRILGDQTGSLVRTNKRLIFKAGLFSCGQTLLDIPFEWIDYSRTEESRVAKGAYQVTVILQTGEEHCFIVFGEPEAWKMPAARFLP